MPPLALPCRSVSILAFSLAVHVAVTAASLRSPQASHHASRKSSSPATHPRAGRVQTGLDVLESQKFAPLRGKHIGIITNHTGLDSQGKSTIDLLTHAQGAQVAFEPIAQLPPRGEGIFCVRCQGRKSGDWRLKVQVSSDQQQRPVSKEESTRVYE